MAPKPDNTELPPTGEKGLKARLVLMARRLLERDGLDALTLRAAARKVRRLAYGALPAFQG